MIMQLQGETVIFAVPVMGYLDRSSVKRGSIQGTGLTDRMDSLSPITTNRAYAPWIQRLTGLVVPDRAEYLRVITSEPRRISSHLLAVGTSPCMLALRCSTRRWNSFPQLDRFVPSSRRKIDEYEAILEPAGPRSQQ